MNNDLEIPTCFQCGSPGGTLRQLCPACEASNDAARQRLKDRLHINSDPEKDSALYRIFSTPALQLAVSGGLAFSIGGVILLMCLTVKVPPTLGFTFAITTISVLICLLTWLMIWLNMLLVEPILALVALLFPPVAYRRLFLFYSMRATDDRWDMFRSTVIAHALSIALVFGSCILLKRFDPGELSKADRKLDKKYGFSVERVMKLVGRSPS
jgi:hypothetical protein